MFSTIDTALFLVVVYIRLSNHRQFVASMRGSKCRYLLRPNPDSLNIGSSTQPIYQMWCSLMQHTFLQTQLNVLIQFLFLLGFLYLRRLPTFLVNKMEVFLLPCVQRVNIPFLVHLHWVHQTVANITGLHHFFSFTGPDLQSFYNHFSQS